MKSLKTIMSLAERKTAELRDTPQIGVTEWSDGSKSYCRSRLNSISDIQVDVRRTDSLVSPYIGEAIFVANEVRTKNCESLDSATKESLDISGVLRDLTDPDLYPLRVRVQFDFTDGKWVWKQSATKLIWPNGSVKPFETHVGLFKNVEVVFAQLNPDTK